MVYGSAVGQRSFNCLGRTYVFEPDTRVVLELIYNPNDKGAVGNFFSSKKHRIDEISGAIYKVKPEFMK